MIKTLNVTVMFTDIKDYTLKSSILTSRQINNLLEKQENMFLPIIRKYNGTIVKSIGDSYMIFFDSPTNAVLCAIDMQKKLQKYNLGLTNPLEKIEIRIGINTGEINEKQTSLGTDYFGETINIASRILNISTENNIFFSQAVYSTMNKNEIPCKEIGNINLKGIPDEIKIYKVIFDEEEKDKYFKNRLNKALRTSELNKEKINIANTNIEKINIKEIDNIIFNISAVCATISLQPLPFIDYFFIFPIHVYLIIKIGIYHGQELSYKNSKILLIQILNILGVDYITKQLIISLYKLGLPIIGAYIAFPITFGVTYGIGKVANAYFYYKSQNIEISNEQLKDIFKDKTKIGKDIGKQNKDKIINIGITMKDKIKSIISSIKK